LLQRAAPVVKHQQLTTSLHCFML